MPLHRKLVHAGFVQAHAGTSAPPGWLLCYGQAVARATYGAQSCLEPSTGMLVALANELTTEMSIAGPATKGHVVNRFARDTRPER